MTEAPSSPMIIEKMARQHWWHRLKDTVFASEAQDILLGAHDATAQEAAKRVDDLWGAEKAGEIAAMRVVLRGVTLADMLSPIHTHPR